MSKKTYKGSENTKGKKLGEYVEKKGSAANLTKGSKGAMTAEKRNISCSNKSKSTFADIPIINIGKHATNGETPATCFANHEFVFKEVRKRAAAQEAQVHKDENMCAAQVQLKQLFASRTHISGVGKGKETPRINRKVVDASEAQNDDKKALVSSANEYEDGEMHKAAKNYELKSERSYDENAHFKIPSSIKRRAGVLAEKTVYSDAEKIFTRMDGVELSVWPMFSNEKTSRRTREISKKLNELLISCGENFSLADGRSPPWLESPSCCLPNSKS